MAELRSQIGSLFRKFKRLLMLIELGKHCTQLEYKSAVVSGHVNGSFQCLSGGSGLGAGVFVAFQPRLRGDLFFLLLGFQVHVWSPASCWGWLSPQTLIMVFVLSLLLVGTRCLSTVSNAFVGRWPASTLIPEISSSFATMRCRVHI